MKPYIYLSLAILSEVVATTALKSSAGFSKVVPSLVLCRWVWRCLLSFVSYTSIPSFGTYLCYLVRSWYGGNRCFGYPALP